VRAVAYTKVTHFTCLKGTRGAPVDEIVNLLRGKLHGYPSAPPDG
jgi:hypothetical protein